ncbi:hypothetical protein SARC_07676 [Sphaeroforma arctica JP610]|uniref:Uncharacterized protein n=1 Tax=Sphaeroforma arctica JP610 TaxID=667725 RepID=A0A0L0FVH9_9EUKA|nr:hypothetical protein SARC_07676 [Sphaeroforma arctica JP610]KNC79948.1 hypothetical protein SARC_07676 [Sphaeroforma arctica JP610]|eukprot:XP_014153850.1 hypothetical protein SARC_07676 [Sphaeroforma arctica JP610]
MPQKPYKITYGTTAAPHGGIHHRYTHTSDGQYAQGEVYETVAAYVAETSLSETQSPYKLDLKGLDHDDDSRRQSDTENPETQHAHTQNSHGQTYAAEQDSEYSDDLSYQLDEVHNNISKLRAHLSRKPSDSDTTRADVWPPPNTEFESRAFGRTSSKLQFNKPDSINSTSRATRTNTYTHTQGHTQTDVTKTFDRSVTAPISSHPQAQTRSTTRHTRNTNPNVPTHSHEPARPRFSQPGKERGLDDVLAKLNRKKDAEIADCKREIEALQKRMSEREALFKDQMKEAMGLDQYKTAMKYRNDLDDLRGKHDGEVAELRAKQLHQNRYDREAPSARRKDGLAWTSSCPLTTSTLTQCNRVQMENDATIQELTQDLDQLRYNHDRTVYELEKAIEQATTSLDAQRHISVERQGENEKLAAENKTLTQDRNLLRTQLQESESVKDGLKTRLETLEKAHADCNDTIAALKTASETLTTDNQATYTEVMEALREDLLNTANQDHTRFKKKILKERSKMVKLTEGYRKQCQQYLESISRNTDTRKRVTLPQSPPLPQDTIHHKTKHGNRNKNTNELNISAHADRPMNIEFVKSA